MTVSGQELPRSLEFEVCIFFTAAAKIVISYTYAVE